MGEGEGGNNTFSHKITIIGISLGFLASALLVLEVVFVQCVCGSV